MRVCTDVKINIGLNVLRKRPDGYHDLETLFVPFRGYGDILEIVPAGEFGIDISRCDWDPMQDLTAKAYRLLRADFPSIPPVHIRLEKNAPVGAGLGGGSADAAFALRLLNEMFSLGLSDSELALYASKLGSDCAFFIYDRPMFGTGRGEILEPFDLDLGAYEIRVEIPAGVSVSTREAYSGIVPRERHSCPEGDGLQPPVRKGQGRLEAIPSGTVEAPTLREALRLPVESWRETVVNDFEASVFPLHPEIARLKQSMYDRGAVYASMSGSGSSVFGLFRCAD